MVSLTALHIKIISTHTLTWSVTRGADVIYRNAGHFNSHAHVERDAEVAKYAVKPGDFNSHAHVERDKSNINNKELHKKFQLTRSRGA